MGQSASLENESKERDQDASGIQSLKPLQQLGVQLVFPIGVFLFAMLYLENTYGRLELGNLIYPYTIITALAILTGFVVLFEIKSSMESTQEDKEPTSPEKKREEASLVSLISRSRKPLIVAVASVGYLFLIGITGFFPASAVTLAGLMRATGVKSWRQIAIVTFLLLIGIWIMFVQVLGLQVPQGTFGV